MIKHDKYHSLHTPVYSLKINFNIKWHIITLYLFGKTYKTRKTHSMGRIFSCFRNSSQPIRNSAPSPSIHMLFLYISILFLYLVVKNKTSLSQSYVSIFRLKSSSNIVYPKHHKVEITYSVIFSHASCLNQSEST